MDFYTYMMILQYSVATLLGLIVAIFVLVPGTIWRIVWARLLRQRVAFGFIANDSGHVYMDKLRQVESKGHKLGLFIGDKTGYVVVPRPTSDIVTKKIVQEVALVDENKNPILDADGEQVYEEQVVNELYFDLNLEDKQAIDEVIQKRHIMDFGGIPVYLGYIGKSFACTPGLIAAMEEYDQNLPDTVRVQPLKLLDPQCIKKYVPWTINPNIIDAIEWKAEQVGYLGRPPSETLKKLALPISIILIMAAIAYFALKNGYI